MGYFYQYYYLILILQGLCLFHSFKKGTQNKWLWIIAFIPLVGCLIYLYSEVINKNDITNLQTGVASIVNPGGRIKDLEARFKFSETFTNRVALANAYLENKMYEKAIALYEPALTGVFNESEDVIHNLIKAYHQMGRYDDIIRIAPRIASTYGFARSKANLSYAIALAEKGKYDEAENEYKKMNLRFVNYESRFYYGDFLLLRNRKPEAAEIFNSIIEEGQHLTGHEKSDAKIWIDKARQEVYRNNLNFGKTS